jgi:hypothetical protein
MRRFLLLAVSCLWFDYSSSSNNRQISPQYQIFRHSPECANALVESETSIEKILNKFSYPLLRTCDPHQFSNVTVVLKDFPRNQTGCPDTVMAQASKFLALLRDKTVGFYGDSLTRQLFNALTVLLFPFQTDFRREGRSFYSHLYKDFGLQIMFCEDGFGESLLVGNKNAVNCTESLMKHSDLIVIGIAAWYKPFYRLHSTVERDYFKNLQLSSQLFEETMRSVRKILSQMFAALSKSPRIIWRLSPHAGSAEELNYLNSHTSSVFSTVSSSSISPTKSRVPTDPHSKDITALEKRKESQEVPANKPQQQNNNLFPHRQGELWTAFALPPRSHIAAWVIPYNKILLKISNEFHDQVFDWFSFSMNYLSFNVSKAVHSDSLHYCLTGMPLGSMIYLYDFLKDLDSKTSNGKEYSASV